MKYITLAMLLLTGCKGHVYSSCTPVGQHDKFELRRSAPGTGGDAYYYSCFDSDLNQEVYSGKCAGLSPEQPK